MNPKTHTLNIGMVGLGMIFDETYRSLLLSSLIVPLGQTGTFVKFKLHSTLTRTGSRAEMLRSQLSTSLANFRSFVGEEDAGQFFADKELHLVVIATPDSRHYEYAHQALKAGKHVLIEKPSVLNLYELDHLINSANELNCLAKVVYHKLFDPDHRMLRSHLLAGHFQHINSGYCSLLEPKSISESQFSEWITGRNPATYVAVHYFKLIDFTFGLNLFLKRIEATGQRGIVGPANGPTWDSVQSRIVYEYPDGREAAFDIHTSWVHPNSFPGYVEQEVQFRFDNAVWNAHQRKRGVEVAVDTLDGQPWKSTPNHHYNATTISPWNEHQQAGYGLEAVRQAFLEVAATEFPVEETPSPSVDYNSLQADRSVVAMVMATEELLNQQYAGHPGGVVFVNHKLGGLVMYRPGESEPTILYNNTV